MLASVILCSIPQSVSLHKQNKDSLKATEALSKLLNSNCSSFNNLDHVVNLKVKFK